MANEGSRQDGIDDPVMWQLTPREVKRSDLPLQRDVTGGSDGPGVPKPDLLVEVAADYRCTGAVRCDQVVTT